MAGAPSVWARRGGDTPRKHGAPPHHSGTLFPLENAVANRLANPYRGTASCPVLFMQGPTGILSQATDYA